MRKDKSYELLTLNAKNILDNGKIIQQSNGNYKMTFQCDLSEKNPVAREMILQEARYKDNAIFYQLEKCLRAEDYLPQTIVFADFKEIFSKKTDFDADKDYRSLKKIELEGEASLKYRLRWLFDVNNGLQLSFDGENYKTFVPFDKSNSMTRTCQISFIDKDLKATLEQRLLLGMDFSQIAEVPAKYYAYRGLYFSAANRIFGDENFCLNAETVVVISDENKTIFKQNVRTATSENSGDSKTPWKFDVDKDKAECTLFDGEGLVCPDYAEFINAQLKSRYKFAKDSTSFQIRMPFTKGVLHTVDFDKFFSEQLAAMNLSLREFKITDVFGIERDLRKAKIILTASMFKCWKWLRSWREIKKLADPMAYFFQKFDEYSHALYVTGTDVKLTNNGKIRLNYQFLSTLAMTADDFVSLIENHIAGIDNLEEKFLHEEPDNDSTYADEEISAAPLSVTDKCLKVLSRNEVFFNDPQVKTIIKGFKRAYERDLCFGRFRVSGEQRFLSHDLLKLLKKILEEIAGGEVGGELAQECLYSEHFYMPENRIKLKADKYYVFLRNPHLSRNEQCMLKPYVKRGSLYEKYFSHLTGIVMVSCESLVPMILSGADFDGDLVKIVSDRRIVEAVKRGVYDLNDKIYKRKLYVVEIPSAPKNSDFDKGYVSFDVIKNTFSNQVGLISNMAVKIADKEYRQHDKDCEDKCAECTVVTGLEIDAAKSGVHPTANISALRDLAKGENLFLKAKDALNKISDKFYTPVVDADEKNSTLSLCLSKKNKKAYLSDVPIYERDADTSLIDMLPGQYLNYLSKAGTKNKKPVMPPTERIYFSFQRQDGWKNNLDSERKAQVVELIQAYLHVMRLSRKVKRMRDLNKDNPYRNRVFYTLGIQYDDFYQKLSDDTSVQAALVLTYAELTSHFANDKEIQDSIDRLITEKWQLTPPENRAEKIAAILVRSDGSTCNLLPSSIELLSNFRENGFMLFYYVLKDIQARFMAEIDAGYFAESEDIANVAENPYYAELYQEYLAGDNRRREENIWKENLAEICREHLKGMFDDMNCALKYACAMPSKDPNREFLWNIFDAEELLANVDLAEVNLIAQ